MNAIFRIIVIVIFQLLFVLFTNAQKIDYSTPDTIEEIEITNGVKHVCYVYNSIPWDINVVEIDINENNSFISVKGKDRIFNSRETLSSIVKRIKSNNSNVVAGINADFFHPNGDIVSSQISKGEFVKGVRTKRSLFGIRREGTPFIGSLNFTGDITTKGKNKININACNTTCGVESVVVYNRYFNDTLKNSGKYKGFLLIPIDSIKNSKSYKAIVSITNDTNIILTDNKYAILANGKKAEELKTLLRDNDTVSIFLGFEKQSEEFSELLGGLPHIIKSGKDISEEQTIKEGSNVGFRNTRHPRTAIGYNQLKNKLFFVVVDGRQQISDGMTLGELASFMLYVGCSEGLNFDGGGSTTMIVNDKIVNSPSDFTGERSVGNALLLLSK
jgi:exopolysaccharide biosynthesis protein